MGFNLLTKRQLEKTMQSFAAPDRMQAEITDYAKYLGGLCIHGYGSYYLKNPLINVDDIGTVGDISFINEDGDYSRDFLQSRKVGIRPAIKYSELINLGCVYDSFFDFATYGEYPQTEVENERLKCELDSALIDDNLNKTGKKYTHFTSLNWLIESPEYEYKGNKYVFNGYTWYRVEPIKWLVGKSSDMAISEKILVAGIKYYDDSNSYKEKIIIDLYKTSTIKKYLDNYFANEIRVSELEPYNDYVTEELLNQIEEIKKMREELGLYQLVLEHNISNHPNAIKPIETIKAQDNRLLEKQKEIQNKIDNYRNEHKVLTKRIS